MDKGFRESHTLEHVFQVKFGNSLGRYRFVAWDEDYCLHAVMCHKTTARGWTRLESVVLDVEPNTIC